MTRIAVVNNDTVFLEMMAEVLREGGWETDIYREGDRAYEQLKASPPDLIILDIRMESPETGWTLLELLTLDPAMLPIPVIVCSAAILDLRQHEELLSLYGVAVLPKPFNIETLYHRVRESLAGHVKQDE